MKNYSSFAKYCLLFCLLLEIGTANCAVAGGAATIEITSVPDFGTSGFLTGIVSGVDYATHEVVTYIQVEGLGWWVKPFSFNPTVPINPDGTFTVDVVTGGLDDLATIFVVALISASDTPPGAGGNVRVPAALDGIALARDEVERIGRTLEFAGRTWVVKEARLSVGPGANRFSSGGGAVFVDAQGRLHLTVSFRDGQWWSTELYLQESLGFGTYSFTTASRVDVLDASVTFGAFLWDPYGDEESVPDSPNREIDFEDARWGNAADPTNSQFVVQPFAVPGNLVRFTLPDLSADQALTRFLTWRACQVRFVSLLGIHSPFNYPPGDVIFDYEYDDDPGVNHFVPSTGRARFRFNLWVFQNSGIPANGERVEVVITDFDFTPRDPFLACPWDIYHDCQVDVTDLLYLLGRWGTAPGGPPDFNSDSVVDVIDLLDLLANWGVCP